jgi:hypothetical protein
MPRQRSAQQHDSVTPKKRRSGQRLTAEEKRRAQAVFLEAFAQSANVTAACRKAGISRETIYRWQEHDATFSLRFKQAEAEANDVIRAAIFQRAVQGVDKPLHYQGRVVVDERGQRLTVKEYSDTLLIFLAKARMPEFRERQQLEVTGKDGGPITYTDARDILTAKLTALTERQRAAETHREFDA